VMESETVAHGPLEFLFTVDEESGLTGASEFPGGLLRSRYFLNLDGEEEGTLVIGCAGGINTVARRTVKLESSFRGDSCRIKVSGLQGGHSGIDINKGRGNALRILGQVLQAALDKLPFSLAAIQGGSKRNAIPREASATVVFVAGGRPQLVAAAEAVEKAARTELGAFDPGLTITVEPVALPHQIMAGPDGKAVIDLLASQHHGVIAMSPDVSGLVQTSTNLATIALDGDVVEIATSQRSPIASSKLAAVRMVTTVFQFAGFTWKSAGDYPGWKPEPASEIVQISKSVHKEILGTVPELVAMHAGLECGVIGEKYPGMQLISFGPHIVDVHSPSERLKVSSVLPFWKYLTGLLERL
jgi:dipeptidase D